MHHDLGNGVTYPGFPLGGENDPALSALATIDHYNAVTAVDPDIRNYMRLFVLPGVLHYGGGNGPSGVDWIALIRDWVENNKAPDKIIASKTNKGKVVMTRPLFPYPDEAIYDGKSDSNLFKVTHFLNFIHIFNVGLNDFIPL